MDSGDYLEKLLTGEIVDPDHPTSQFKPGESVPIKETASISNIHKNSKEDT